MAEKARYWTWVGYPESMIDGWEEEIADVLQYPFVYCVHDKDEDGAGDKRKTHVHVMIAYSNTTTLASVQRLFAKLRSDGDVKKTYVESVQNVRHVYDYLIHDTESSRKKNKYQYDATERICGNGFDIGAYEQLSVTEKDAVLDTIIRWIEDYDIEDFYSLYEIVRQYPDKTYRRVFRENDNFLKNLVSGYYHRKLRQYERKLDRLCKEERG